MVTLDDYDFGIDEVNEMTELKVDDTVGFMWLVVKDNDGSFEAILPVEEEDKKTILETIAERKEG